MGVTVPLFATLVAPERSPSVGGLFIGVGVTVAAIAVIRLALELRSMRSRARVARYVGSRAPEVASDVLSAVELAPPENSENDEGDGVGQSRAKAGDRRAPHSEELVEALADSAGRRLAALAPEVLVPRRSLRRPAAAAAGVLAASALVYAFGADRVRHGWRQVLSGSADDSGAAGALRSEVPLVGDIRIELRYPDYTGRPPLTLPTSSGDFTAMPGTVVSLTTSALAPAAGAEIVMVAADDSPPHDDGGDDDAGEERLPLTFTGDQLRGELLVRHALEYRFALRPPEGPPVVEARPHRIDIETDRAPAVELYAPADELDVTDTKRIELAYTTEDDYGIGDMHLVWKPEGDTSSPAGDVGRLKLDPPPAGARTAQGKFLWDLAAIDLPPGSRIAYHLEVGDNDTVSGPNIGRSRTYFLRVYSPRERHELLLARQRDMFERAIRLLGGRLVVASTDLPSHRELNKETGKLVVEMGGVLADLAEDELAGKDLIKALTEMKARLDALAGDESKLLDGVSAQADPITGKLPPRAVDKLGGGDRKQVAELEDDVVTLDRVGEVDHVGIA